MLGILGWIVFGFVIGLLARALYPGPQKLGFVMTTLLGVAGSFLGGFAVYLIRGGEMLQPTSYLGSLFGALVLLAVGIGSHRRRVS